MNFMTYLVTQLVRMVRTVSKTQFTKYNPGGQLLLVWVFTID